MNPIKKKVILLGILAVVAFGLTGTALAETYTYDTPGRLTGVTYNDGSSITYTYDNNGNLTSIVKTAAVPPPPNSPPVCQDVSLTTDEDTPGITEPDCMDADGDALTYAIVTQAANGTASIGSLNYTPDAGFTGTDSFTYKANDGTVDSIPATVNVTVTAIPPPPNTPPVCLDVAITTGEDTAGSTQPNCTDADGDALTYAIVAQPSNGTATVSSLNYTPDAAFTGTDSFTYKANDGIVDSNTATVAVTVKPTNGLLGEYYNNADLNTLILARFDPEIKFDWGTGSPDGAIDPDTFSVRWAGKLMVDSNETYTFSAVTDDGVRFWIDGHLVINYWNTGGVSIDGAIDLTSGIHDIKLEFFEDTGDAFVSLSWSSASNPQAIIPTDHLFPPPLEGSAPVLSFTGEANFTSNGLHPEMGDSIQIFTYRLQYFDADSEDPMTGYPRVHILNAGAPIPGSPFAMSFESGDPSGGSIYIYNTTLPDGTDYSYYFDALDVTGRQALSGPVAPTPTAPINAPIVGETVETVPNPVGEGNISVMTSSGVLENVSAVDPTTLPDPPEAVNFPFGLVTYRIAGLAPGESVEVTIDFPDTIPDGVVWYWFNSQTIVWTDISSNVVVNGSSATVTITDGGIGDSDATANGVIDDPIGPSVFAGEAGQGGGGDGGFCFIATAAYGSYLDPDVQVLREFRDAYLLTHKPGQAFVSIYYQYSPHLADFIREHEAARTLTRWALTPIVYAVEYPGSALIVFLILVIVPVIWRVRNKVLPSTV